MPGTSMDLDLSSSDLTFRNEVRQLIENTFPGGEPYEGSASQERRWHDALLDRGWAANKWPPEFGGPG